jgi:signal transduction histidine kinase
MMAVVVVLTAGWLVFAERAAAANAERALHDEFQSALTAQETARQTRSAELAARCLALVRKSRIHAALEDDALDLLYLSARDELADLIEPNPSSPAVASMHAKFYRFLDAHGGVIPSPDDEIGELTTDEATRLALPSLPSTPQLGYLARSRATGDGVWDEVITTPIRSTATNRPIAALVVGFATDLAPPTARRNEIRRGLWLDRRLHLPAVDAAARAELSTVLDPFLSRTGHAGFGFQIALGGVPHLLLCQQLNPASQYPAAFEVSLYSLAPSLARQRSLRVNILSAGGLLILVGLAVTQVVAARLSRPVEKLAAHSEANVARRRHAEASLKSTQVELQRAARFSADASHQLKTPVAVLRAGLQELLAREDLTAPVRLEVATLFSETHRFTGMIEDLLLLSRMDAGRLTIEFAPVDLTHLVASWIDDLSVRPDDMNLDIISELPPELCIAGERRYTWHVLANLLENAHHYNRPGGIIKISATVADAMVHLTIGNTGRPIPSEAQPHIFERFHRAGASSGVPGHGLGLNLARELAHLHGGELQLVRSADDWTELEVTFRVAVPASSSAI